MENETIHPRWSKTAIAGFVLSIPGIPLGLSTFGIIPILSIILGIVSIKKINGSDKKLKGKSFSIASIIIGGIGLVIPLWLLTAVIWTIIIQR